MRDKIEQFINEHRQEFDSYEPGEHVWEGLNKKLKRRNNSGRRKYVTMAACVLIIAGATAWFLKSTPKTDAHAVATMALAPELEQAEKYYAVQVKEATTELNKYSMDYPELCKGFDKEMGALETAYSQLKEEYKGANGNEAVIRAMLENLQLQMKILSVQLQILQNIKHKEANKGKNYS